MRFVSYFTGTAHVLSDIITVYFIHIILETCYVNKDAQALYKNTSNFMRHIIRRVLISTLRR